VPRLTAGRVVSPLLASLLSAFPLSRGIEFLSFQSANIHFFLL
jgi:hypothetical protein